MEQYVIKGGVPLSGEVEIGGAKNAALAILAAAIMTDETVTIDNLPDVRDINVLLDAIAGIGAKVERIDSHTVKINGSYIDCLCVDYDLYEKNPCFLLSVRALLWQIQRGRGRTAGRMQYRKPTDGSAYQRI